MLLNNILIKEVNINEFKQREEGLFTKSYKDGFVFIGASWCGYCRKISPEIEKLASAGGLRLTVLFIDGEKDSNTKLLNLLSVKGFPTLFMLLNNKLIPYTGERDHQSMLAKLCEISNKDLCFNN